MNSVGFLLTALAMSVIGISLLAIRAREPRGTNHSVKSFEREMKALDPSFRKTRDRDRGSDDVRG